MDPHPLTGIFKARKIRTQRHTGRRLCEDEGSDRAQLQGKDGQGPPATSRFPLSLQKGTNPADTLILDFQPP